MDSIKNKIVTISGEPASGKESCIQAMVATLQQKGMAKENIHLICTGTLFREMVEFLNNIENPDRLKELSQGQLVKNILQNESDRQNFINQISTLKAEGISFSGISVEQLNNMPYLAGICDIVDGVINHIEDQLALDMQMVSKPDEIWIVDSRAAFSHIPDAFSVQMIRQAEAEVAGERMYARKHEEGYDSLESAIRGREERRKGEIERFKNKYGVDISDENHYQMVIDTSYVKGEDAANVILKGLALYTRGNSFPKKWANPRMFLPTQSIGETCRGFSNIEEIEESIKQNEYDIQQGIEVVEVDNVRYILDGHHRNFAAASVGVPLVPFDIVAKDDDGIPGYAKKFTARQFTRGVEKKFLRDHETFFDRNDSKMRFSYEQVYHGIYSQLEKEDVGR